MGWDLLKVIGLGLVGVFLVQILVVLGLHYTTAFHLALIMATIPILTLGFSILLGREAYHIQKILGILIGFGGVATLLFSKSPNTPLPEHYMIGDCIAMLNAVAFSWFLLGSQKMLQKIPSFTFMAYCYIFSALLFAALFVGVNTLHRGVSGLAFMEGLRPEHWLLVLYVVLFASIGTYTLNNYALQRISPSVVSVYMFIQPVISAVTGFYCLQEPFNLHMALSAVITFVGVILATTASQPKDTASLRASLETPLEEQTEKANAG